MPVFIAGFSRGCPESSMVFFTKYGRASRVS